MGRDRGSSGWRILQILAMAAFALNAVAVVVVLVTFSRHDGLWVLLRDASRGLVTLAFWRWIALGAAARADRTEPPAPDPVARRPVVPWNVVGAILGAILITGFGAMWMWDHVEGNRQEETIDRLRADAVAEARARSLTVAQVEQARAESLTEAWSGSGKDPLATLIDVPDATVADASVDDGEALVLLRPNRGAPPCVILRIAADGEIDTLETRRCS